MRILLTIAVVAAACGVDVRQPAQGGGWDDGFDSTVYIHHYRNYPIRVLDVYHVRRLAPRYLHVYHIGFPFRGMGPTYAYARYRYFHHWRRERQRW